MKVTAIIFVLITISLNSFSQIGSLDLSFGVNGIVTTNYSNLEYGKALAIQQDGKILLAGSCYTTSSNSFDFAILRYHPNGTLDSTFDGDGIVFTNIGTGDDQVNDLTIQPDGKIVVCGSTQVSPNSDNIAVARYNIDGTLDTTFHADGMVITSLGLGDQCTAHSISLQLDGKIAVGGYATLIGFNPQFCIVRYETNGSLDNTFDNDGYVTTPFSTMSYGTSLEILPTGKFLLTGKLDGSMTTVGVIRYNPNGSIDSTFDGDGKAIVNMGATTYSFLYKTTLQSDGKLLITGEATDTLGLSVVVSRLNQNGGMDSTFDSDGKTNIAFGTGNVVGSDVVVQPNGKILVLAGSVSNNSSFYLLSFHPYGGLDSSFGINGIATTSIVGSSCYGNALAQQTDGKILVGGEKSIGFLPDFCVGRFNNASPVGFSEFKDENNSIKIYPNPVSSIATIESTFDLQNASLIAYDIYGRKVMEWDNLIGNHISIFRNKISNGIYGLQLIENQKIIWKGNILVNDQ